MNISSSLTTSIKKKRKKSLNSKASSTVHKAHNSRLHIDKLPRHIAIIMDGNGRWAKKRLFNRIKGHEQGVETVREIVETSSEIGISVLTLYAFSTENWQRPKIEVAALMAILKKFVESELPTMMENNIRLNAIGQIERLPDEVKQSLKQAMILTRQNKGMLLNLALSYGGRADIVRMVRSIGEEIKKGKIDTADITPTVVGNHLYTKEIPDPDLLIRTSGEKRISNFLLWQIAYTEICFTDTLWPDFNQEEYVRILIDFQNRERRYGKVE
ncbi:isoprenyl transferase [Thermodesulfobacteriota bacterium]